MPMYEYRCLECGTKYEQLRRMSDADKNLECPVCGSPNVRREISACAIGGSSSSSSSGGGCVPRGGFS
ncbi:MAG: zinc ribbon domain-containing protein [Bryobacteraceae bacterium]|jgi:putative FmdB family regulatory protein